MMNSTEKPVHRSFDVITRLQRRLSDLQPCLGDRPRPIITLTYAQSMDGCIAPFEGGTLQLSNAKSRQLTHQVRAMHDAILVGIDTVLCDDPLLTVRLANGKNPQPIVLDSRLRFPLNAKLLRDPCVRPIIATSHRASEDKAKQLSNAGAHVIRVPLHQRGLIDLFHLFPLARQMGVRSIMVEGGSRVITNILASGLADHLLLVIAPRFVGGLRAVQPSVAGQPLPQLQDICCQWMDEDLVVWGHLETTVNLNSASTSPSCSRQPPT